MSVNFNATTPAAIAGTTNVVFQTDGSGNISGYVPTSSSVAFSDLESALSANYNSGSAKTIFTPTAPTALRITATEFSTNIPTGATLPSLTLGWTDAGGTMKTLALFSSTSSVSAAGVYATNYAATTASGGIQAVIYTNSSTAVTVTSASYAAGSGTALTYALAITAEAL
jgi:hypothetical protein